MQVAARRALLGFTLITALIATPSSAAVESTEATPGSGRYDEVKVDFTSKPDGEWTAADTGQPVTSYPRVGSPNEGMRPRVVGGRLTFDHPGPAGGYSSVELDDNVTRLGASFVFSPYTTNNGVAAVAATVGEIGASYEADQGVPQMPAHLTVGPTGWDFATFPGDGGGIKYLASGRFEPPLAADNTTVHSAQVDLDLEAGRATITLPDGTSQVVEDPSIQVDGATWAFAEPYRFNSGGTDTLPQFTTFWADSAAVAPPARMDKPVVRDKRKGTLIRWRGATSDLPVNSYEVVWGDLRIVAPADRRRLYLGSLPRGRHKFRVLARSDAGPGFPSKVGRIRIRR